MCRVIAVSNQKGGVGKTVSCVNLGIGLAKEGNDIWTSQVTRSKDCGIEKGPGHRKGNVR